MKYYIVEYQRKDNWDRGLIQFADINLAMEFAKNKITEMGQSVKIVPVPSKVGWIDMGEDK
jgi:hypothetical protein